MDPEAPVPLDESTLLVAIDDTDTVDSEYGTGRVSRFLGEHLAAELPGLTYRGSVRQQFLVDDRIPYTTHNSGACLLCTWDSDRPVEAVIETAATFLADIAADGSDPGLCVGRAGSVTEAVQAFGREAGEVVLEESRAGDLAAEAGLFLEEYGGTGEGVIGALAAVGRTVEGDRGRFIDFGPIREFEGTVQVGSIAQAGIHVVTADGSVVEGGTVETGDWIRPALRDGRPTLELEAVGEDRYRPTNSTR